MSLVLTLVLPISGFASVGLSVCQEHSGAKHHHVRALSSTTNAAKAPHHRHQLAPGGHVDHMAGRDAYCHCAGALALALFAQLPADFDLQLSLAFAVSEQSHLGDAQRGTPYRPPIHATV